VLRTSVFFFSSAIAAWRRRLMRSTFCSEY
jgi:hypothetical protein